MKFMKLCVFLICQGFCIAPHAQEAEKAMTFGQLESWQRISSRSISDDGKWVMCKMEPWVGDATIRLYDAKGKETASFRPAESARFDADSRYLLVTRVPAKNLTDSLKLKKTPEKDMPVKSLEIYRLAGGSEQIDSLRSYRLSETAGWLAYQRGTKADSSLYVRSLDGSRQEVFPHVTDFRFAEKNNILYYVSDSSLYTFTPEKRSVLIYRGTGKGIFKQIAWDEKGDKLAFLYCPDKDSTATGFSLYLSEQAAPARLVAGRTDPAFPAGWVISGNESPRFSRNAARLFFGTAPAPKQKDTTLLDANRPQVQIWKWDEGVQYTVQSFNKERDLKRAYAAVYNLASNRLFQLTTPEFPILQTAGEGNANLALLATTEPYETKGMWEGRNWFDIQIVDLETGQRKPFKKESAGYVRLSPEGKYAYWYNQPDSSWYTYSLEAGKEYRLTTPQTFPAWDEENDVPDYAPAYGSAGWTTGDRYLLLYDRFDIWKFDPEAASTPVNLTVNGRRDSLSYQLLRLDPEQRAVDLSAPQYLRSFSMATKGRGYYKARFSSPKAPETLLAGNYSLSVPVKARHADAVLYTSETFEKYPDLLLSDLTFRKSLRLTDGIRQQEGIRWGTAELVSWVSLDGRRLQGVVYKPAGFDPNKKYPLLVNFYERNSSTLYEYHMPEPHRSTIDYHFYNSHEYIIFNPDVWFTDGYPGESSFNCVMPGITALLAKGYIDEKAIGAQGHSWGGYQVAYLATRTRLFAAIESGAPVVNMLSAYGGIRWGTGLNRSFQYEHGQSRIGGSIWEKPMQYIENSPLFGMEKVTTPILIMHNDNDGHVPWYQGIEFFVALKRLQKPVWLLNYPGEVHWPMRMANRVDFQKRMFQFFDHYLRQTPMPKWMSEGIPAVDQDYELGY